ncbi:unnamed protein product, partial [Musa textilis]
ERKGRNNIKEQPSFRCRGPVNPTVTALSSYLLHATRLHLEVCQEASLPLEQSN